MIFKRVILIMLALEVNSAPSSYGKLEYYQEKPGSDGFTKQDIEWVWQAPEKISGILFLAHGCMHNAKDFWEKSDECLSCIGLPEERKMVKFGLENNYFVVAISSLGKCWDVYHDSDRVLVIFEEIRKVHEISNIPMFAIGVSSGGSFVARLPHFVPKVAAVAIQIASVPSIGLLGEMPLYPPSLWICMEKDMKILAAVKRTTTALQKHGRHAEMIVAPALAITPHFFSDRIPNFPRPGIADSAAAALSSKIVSRLKIAGILDDAGRLKEDPRRSNWRNVLQHLLQSGHLHSDTLEADKSAISEELNLAFAYHEITADFMSETLQFFLTHRNNNS